MSVLFMTVWIPIHLNIIYKIAQNVYVAGSTSQPVVIRVNKQKKIKHLNM